MNSELECMWKEVVVEYFEVWPGISLKGLSKSTTSLSRDSRYQGQDLKRNPSEYKSELPTILLWSSSPVSAFINYV